MSSFQDEHTSVEFSPDTSPRDTFGTRGVISTCAETPTRVGSPGAAKRAQFEFDLSEPILVDEILDGRFIIHAEIGSGSFGRVFSATDTMTGLKVAIKTELSSTKLPLLPNEAWLYRELHGAPTVPTLHSYGTHKKHNYVALDILGKSLEDLFVACNRKFSLKTVMMLADQMVTCMQCVHSRRFLYRDVKPENFLLGIGTKAKLVHIIDFGLSKPYWDAATETHIPYREGTCRVGTARYTSIASHHGIEQGRRDDLESIGYVLVYFLTGRLPWQGLGGSNAKIVAKKLAVSPASLCAGLPSELVMYFEYVRHLPFGSCPDYNFLRNLFWNVLRREGLEYDLVYDWESDAI